MLRFEVCIRHPRADIKHTVEHMHLGFGRKVQAGNRNMEIIHIGWNLELQDKMRTAEDC